MKRAFKRGDIKFTETTNIFLHPVYYIQTIH